MAPRIRVIEGGKSARAGETALFDEQFVDLGRDGGPSARLARDVNVSVETQRAFEIKGLVDAAKHKPSGWIEYVMKNPTTGKLENKTAYWEMHDGLIFKAGTYTE